MVAYITDSEPRSISNTKLYSILITIKTPSTNWQDKENSFENFTKCTETSSNVSVQHLDNLDIPWQKYELYIKY